MNKRIKTKRTRIKNTKGLNDVLDIIKKRYTVSIVDFDKNYGQCSFKLKELGEWLFCIYSLENGITIIGEYMDFIDKFRPNRTYITKQDLNEFLNVVDDIKSNPKKHIVASRRYADNIEEAYYEYKKNNDTIEEFIDREYNDYIVKKKERDLKERLNHDYVMNIFKNELFEKFPKLLEVGVIDGNKNGFECYPRYNVRLLCENNLLQDEFEELWKDILKYEDDICYSEKMKHSKNQFSIHSLDDTRKDLKLCDYVFKKQ